MWCPPPTRLPAQAGLRMMLKGGNAVDAAIAAAAVMTLIVEPVSNGLGSDAFAILWDGKELHGLNASGPAPPGLDARILSPQIRRQTKTPPKRGAGLGHRAGRRQRVGWP